MTEQEYEKQRSKVYGCISQNIDKLKKFVAEARKKGIQDVLILRMIEWWILDYLGDDFRKDFTEHVRALPEKETRQLERKLEEL